MGLADDAVSGQKVPAPRRPMLRVALVADLRLTAETVRAALQDKGYAVTAFVVPTGAAASDELRRHLAALRPAVGLLVNEASGIVEMTSALQVVHDVPGVRWVVLTGNRSEDLWGAGLEAGAIAVLPMTIRITDLVSALEQIRQGADLISAGERERLLRLWEARELEQSRLLAMLAQLTPRESQVLAELRRGHSVARIALAGDVSVGTVRSQVKSILRKLDVPSQLAAVALLQRASELVQPRRVR